MPLLCMRDVDLQHKTVLIRVDFNLPIKNGKVTSDIRMKASLPTIKLALQQQAKVILMSHLGRPTEGKVTDKFSLQPVADHLAILLNQPVRLQQDWLNGVDIAEGEVVLCENVRFNVGETSNDSQLAQQMAALCDVFVMDAFGSAHRAHASTCGVAEFAPIACAGPLLSAELEALSEALEHPKRPLVVIVGGAKISTKLTVLQSLCQKADQLIVGGGIANTFLAAKGHMIGQSLCEPNLIVTANDIIKTLEESGNSLPLPVDVRVATQFSETATAVAKSVDFIEDNEMILDIGPQSEKELTYLLGQAGTIVWNGPVGVFEFPEFASGTKMLAQTIAASKAFSIAGGGDTLAAIDQFGVKADISYISTGGGAFLALLGGGELPAVEVLASGLV